MFFKVRCHHENNKGVSSFAVFTMKKHNKNHDKTMFFRLQNRSETATACKIVEERSSRRFPRLLFAQELHFWAIFGSRLRFFVSTAAILAPPRGLGFLGVKDFERFGDAWVPARQCRSRNSWKYRFFKVKIDAILFWC